MIVVADSGSTKTAWAIRAGGDAVRYLNCEGLNPHFTPDERYLQLGNWLREAMREMGPKADKEPLAIYFYGAGCGTEEKQKHIKIMLHSALPEASEIGVAGDLLAACRALYGRSAGVVGILGTGSNACYYDGEKIADQVFSTGYLLGDEGSGNHIGRRLLKSYLTKQMPSSLSNDFHHCYGLSDAAFLEQIYRKPNANRFLASLAPFALKHSEEPFVAALLDKVFDAYICEQVMPVMPPRTSNCELRAVGGIAAHFERQVKDAAKRHGIDLTTTLERPLERLMAFHNA